MTNVTTTVFDISNGMPPSWGGMVVYMALFVFIPISIMVMGIAVLWSAASYTRFKKYLDAFANSFKYAFFGLITCVVLAIPMMLVYWGYTQAKIGNTVPLQYVFYILAAYIILAIIGKLVDKYVIKRIKTFENEINPDKKIFESDKEEIIKNEQVFWRKNR